MTHQDRFEVRWTITDSDAVDPVEAARSALELLADARPGDPDASTLFTVVDRELDRVHTVDLAQGEPELEVQAHWPRPAGTRFQTRLAPADARAFVDEHGFATLLVRIDQGRYLEGHAMHLSGSGGDDHFDYLHACAYSFGVAHDCTARIVEVDPDAEEFIVEYTTDLRPSLRLAEEVNP